METIPNLKPKKHAWYAACFVVLLLSAFSAFLKEMLSQPGSTGSPVEIAGSVAFALGDSLVTLVVLTFPLALIFFFNGRFSRAIVGLVLAIMTLTQAVELGKTIRRHIVGSTSPRPEPRLPAAAPGQASNAETPVPVTEQPKRKRTRHAAATPGATER